MKYLRRELNQVEKAEKPVAERRQRRDLRKRVRIDDNATDVNENVIEAVEVPVVETVQNEVVENNVADNAEDKHVKNVSVVLHVIYVHRIINAVVVMK